MQFKTINVHRLAIEHALTLPPEDMQEFLSYGLNVGFYKETRYGWPEVLEAAKARELPVSGKIRRAIAGKFYKGETAMAKAAEDEVIRILAEELDLRCCTEL